MVGAVSEASVKTNAGMYVYLAILSHDTVQPASSLYEQIRSEAKSLVSNLRMLCNVMYNSLRPVACGIMNYSPTTIASRASIFANEA